MTPADADELKALGDGVIHAAEQAEAKWGVDRLRLLVSADLRTKFDQRVTEWRAALEEAYDTGTRAIPAPLLERVRSLAAAVEKGWAVLDRKATEAGAPILAPEVWEVAGHDGQVIALTRTTAEAVAVAHSGRRIAVYTLAEFANLQAALPAAIAAAKVEFPGATVQPPRRRMFEGFDDPIPFDDRGVA